MLVESKTSRADTSAGQRQVSRYTDRASNKRQVKVYLIMKVGGIPKAQLRVIVAEDNSVVRRVLCGIIRQDENLILVGEASHGAAALKLVKTFRPDVLCLDLIMPGMDGIAALRQIQVDYPEVRVIIVSGDSTAEAVSEVRSLGCSGFVVKPFTAAKVLRAIYSASGTAESSPRGSAAES